MKDNQQEVKIRKAKKYSSYMVKITKAAENLINRNFCTARPNHKMLTDITEFSIPAGKVYLSSTINCLIGRYTHGK